MRQWMYRLLLCITLFAQAGGAVPAIPMVVSGSVYINGAPAPVGTAVEAMIGGEVKGNTTVSQSGVYGMTVDYGQGLVEFYVNDTKAQSINWSIEPRILNLTVTITQTTPTGVATTALPENRYTQSGGTGATRTSIQTTTPIARATDTAISIAQTTVVQEENSQKQQAVRSPGFEVFIVVLTVLLASKAIIRRRKR